MSHTDGITSRSEEYPNTPLYSLEWMRITIATILCGLMLALPAVLNGAPFLYFDSADYISIPERALQQLAPGLVPDALPRPPGETKELAWTRALDRHDDRVFAGRSIYYGAFAYVSALLKLWPLVAVQSLVLGWLIALTFASSIPRGPIAAPVVTSVALTVLTPAGFFTGLAMPDIWAGMLILATAIMIGHHRQLSVLSQCILSGVMVFAVLSHASHLMLLIIMTLLAVVIWAFSARVRLITSLTPIIILGLCAFCGFVGGVTFSAVVEEVYGKPPVRLPFVTAHLVDLGPGTAYAHSACPEAGYALCAYADRLPTGWIDFLFNRDPAQGVFGAAPPDMQRALAAEQLKFAAHTALADPLGTLGGLSLDGLRQLWHISVADLPIGETRDELLYNNFPADLVSMTRESILYPRGWLMDMLTSFTQVSTGMAILTLMGVAFRRRTALLSLSNDRRFHSLIVFAVVCLSGLILNALICGMIASPYDRFQARVVWIFPLLAAVVVVTSFNRRRQGS